ncbi:MAG: helix-turn-helix domain-containing protein [Pseudomonas mandelii]
MPGKKSTPDQSIQAVVLREAGWTIPAIAERLESSISTVQRLLKKNHAVAGAASQALIEKAREEMLNTVFVLENVQQIAASLVLDDLAISQQIRLKLAEAMDLLDPTNPIVFRALAASATTLKLTQDVGRRALPLEKLNESLEVEQLPELHIRLMTEDDVDEMRAQQRLEDAEINGDREGVEDELETIRWLKDQRTLKKRHLDDDIVVDG